MPVSTGAILGGGIGVFGAHRNLKVDKLLGVGAHLVVEAELVLAGVPRREDKVALPLLLAVHDVPPIGARDAVVDVEGAAGLHLQRQCK